MADHSESSPVFDRAVESALKAYDDGYRIIAGWFNAAFEAWNIDLQIDADPPPPGVTLDDCRRRLSNSLRIITPFCQELETDERRLFPWVVGYLRTESDQPGKVLSGISLGADCASSPWGSAEQIERIVSVKHGYGWKDAGQWRPYVVEPMKKNAKSWREWLSSKAQDVREIGKAPKVRAPRRSKFTDADEKIISALLKHHEYESPQRDEFSSVGNTSHASYQQLCDLSGVKSKDTIKTFFDKWFPEGGNDAYKRACKAGAKTLGLEIARLIPGDVPSFGSLYIDKEA